jgi:hypothetical protein
VKRGFSWPRAKFQDSESNDFVKDEPKEVNQCFLIRLLKVLVITNDF